jgi:hypothetical protein
METLMVETPAANATALTKAYLNEAMKFANETGKLTRTFTAYDSVQVLEKFAPASEKPPGQGARRRPAQN